MENCLLSTLKGKINNNNLPFYDAFTVVLAAGEATSRNIRINLKSGESAKITLLNGGDASQYVSVTQINASTSAYTNVGILQGGVTLLITNLHSLTYFDNVQCGDYVAAVDAAKMLQEEVIDFFGNHNANDDSSILDTAKFIKATQIEFSYSKVAGSLNDFAEAQIANGRDYTTDPSVVIRTSNKITYWNGTTTVSCPNSTYICVVYIEGGYQLRDTNATGTILYDSTQNT